MLIYIYRRTNLINCQYKYEKPQKCDTKNFEMLIFEKNKSAKEIIDVIVH